MKKYLVEDTDRIPLSHRVVSGETLWALTRTKALADIVVATLEKEEEQRVKEEGPLLPYE